MQACIVDCLEGRGGELVASMLIVWRGGEGFGVASVLIVWRGRGVSWKHLDCLEGRGGEGS